MSMFGIGTSEILLILALAVIIIGPKKLPEVATALGKGLGEFKRAFEDLRDSASVDLKTQLEKEELLKSHPHLANEPPKPAEGAAPESRPESSPPGAQDTSAEGQPSPGGEAAGAPTEVEPEPGYRPEDVES